MMFGPRLSRVFASRWSALWWAATILLLAWEVVPAPDEDGAETGVAVAGHPAAANPWAVDKPAAGR